MSRIYQTNELAEIGNIHPNTVRIYEEWGYLSPAPRAQNGYRVFREIHAIQLKIARLAFRNEIIQNGLRKRATQIVRLSGEENFSTALREAKKYLHYLQQEHAFVLKSIETVKNHMNSVKTHSDTIFTHQQMAKRLQITEEVLRNWERNGLFRVKRNAKRQRQYTEMDYEHLLIIRALRSAHFSISSMLRLVLEQSTSMSVNEIKHILNSPKITEDIYHVTDRLEISFRAAIKDIQELIDFLNDIVKGAY